MITTGEANMILINDRIVIISERLLVCPCIKVIMPANYGFANYGLSSCSMPGLSNPYRYHER